MFMNLLRKPLMAIIMVVAIVFGVNAQQTKRNLIANSCFEEGLKNWRVSADPDFATVSIDEDQPISGNASVKVDVHQKTVDTWGINLFYFMPIEQNVKYKLTFKAKATAPARFKIELCRSHGSDYWPLVTEEVPEGWIVEHDNVLRGTIPVDTEVREYTFITDGLHSAHWIWNYTLAFHFGRAEEGVSYWIDDVKMSRIGDGDWDGNLFTLGDFECGPEFHGFWYDFWAENCLAEISTDNPISGEKSLHFYNGVGTGPFWGLSFNFPFWNNENTNYEVRLKAKVSHPCQFMFRTHFDPWAYGDDILGWDNDATDAVGTVKEFVLTRENAVWANGLYGGFDAGQYGEFGFWEGQQRMFGSFIEQLPIPHDSHIWIDDVQVREFVTLQGFTVVKAPNFVEVNGEAQFTIGEYVTPTHAPATVVFTVIDGTGKATIDQNGVIKGVEEGDVTVKITSPDGEVEKMFNLTVVATSIKGINVSNIQLSQTVISAGGVIRIIGEPNIKAINIYNLDGRLISTSYNKNQIETAKLRTGIYLVKIQPETGVESLHKILVK